MSRMNKRRLDCSGMTLEEAQHWGTDLCEMQRDIPWLIGDLARYWARKMPGTWQQVFPEGKHDGLILRCKAVAEAYPGSDDREHDLTWTQYMQASSNPDRQAVLAAIADKGLTSDESRQQQQAAKKGRVLLAFDVSYALHRNYEVSGVRAARLTAEWIERLAHRLAVTDVVCAMDSVSSFRKDLTVNWERPYKDRGEKDPKLIEQLSMVQQLIEERGYLCVRVVGHEADDVLASYAKQFRGAVILVTHDKDLHQCLAGKRVAMLLSVDWIEDGGDWVPSCQWMTEDGLLEKYGLKPCQWIDYQCMVGDSADNIQGAPGVGDKNARMLLEKFGSVEAAIAAAKSGNEEIKPRQAAGLIKLGDELDVVRQLVTLRDDLSVPMHTTPIMRR